jgi:outer membrane protein assembly factor BamC
MLIKKLTTLLLVFSLGGCIPLGNQEKQKQDRLGERDIKYYSNKTLTSLEVPPDLTKPSTKNALKLSEYVTNIQQDLISFSAKDSAIKEASSVLTMPSNVEVMKSGSLRWLVVDKKPDAVWGLAKSFFKSHGFIINKANKKIGVMETDFLENHPEISDQSLGFIRSMLRKATKTRYTLPIADKYRLRIEPTDNGNKTEVYLSLTSMQEVLTNKGSDDENTIWQSQAKDHMLETEMLYRLMTFLGSDHALAREKIMAAREQQKLTIKIAKSMGGYAKLVFSLTQHETWNNIGWALDQLGIDVEDKDVKEGSFYINIAKEEDKGIFSRLFGDDSIKKSFQIVVRQVDSNITEVYFNDLSEENKQATIDFSYQFLGNIARQF